MLDRSYPDPIEVIVQTLRAIQAPTPRITPSIELAGINGPGRVATASVSR
jgi:hypothetical protein